MTWWRLLTAWRSLFFFNDTATTEIYTLSLHDALPIFKEPRGYFPVSAWALNNDKKINSCELRIAVERIKIEEASFRDRKSTRLNSSHANISYAVFCLKKKKHSPPNASHSCLVHILGQI